MDTELCESCQAINIEQLDAGHKHGSSCARIFETRVKCSLCNLLCAACFEDPNLLPAQTCLYLRKSPSDTVSSLDGTVSWAGACDVFCIPDSYEQPAEHYQPLGFLRIFATDVCGSDVLKLLHGRPITPPDCDTAIRRCRTWLSTCLSDHPSCRLALSGDTLNDNISQPKLPTRVIDVTGPARLFITGGKTSTYLALSYCWGKVVSSNPASTKFSLTKGTVQAYIQALPHDDLPKTIRDAIEVTRRLGFRYLWVDSVCIVQDSEGDWQRESRNMGRIFQNATCVIAATAAENNTEGLFSRNYSDVMVNGSDVLQKSIIRTPCRSQGRIMGQMCVAQMSRLPWPCINLKSFQQEMEQSSWHQRAWVVQERILARRILHFGQTQLFFECQYETMAEASALPLLHTPQYELQSKRAIRKRIANEATMVNSLTAASRELRSLRAIAALSYDSARYMLGTLTSDVASSAQARFWSRVVSQYNATAITRQSDKLFAILGLAQMVASRLSLTYCAGLWVEDIARSLYWWADIEGSGLLYPLSESGGMCFVEQ